MGSSKNIVIAGCIAFVVIVTGMSYNSLQTTKIDADAKYGQVENQIQRRADLIPNLVNTVKGYAKHEEKVLTEVTEARAKVANAKGVEEMAAANGELSNALGRLMVVVESYPQLKADAHFTELMREISGTENRIAVARKDYNEAVRDYNIAVSTLPKSILAGFMGFNPRPQFEADAAAKAAPKVEF